MWYKNQQHIEANGAWDFVRIILAHSNTAYLATSVQATMSVKFINTALRSR